MSFLTDFVEGFAQLLAAANIGLTWSPTGVYTTGVTGLYVMAMPATPNRAVALTPYPLSDDPTLSDSEIGLQVLSRSAAADPRDVFALDDTVADVLLGSFPMTLPNGIDVTTLMRASATSLGQDDNRRWSWVSNYPVGVYRPSLHRL